MNWTQITLSALEKSLENRPTDTEFCYTDFPTFAEIALVPQIANARRFKCDLSAFPLLRDIEARCKMLPAFAKARSEQQIDYNGKTSLGK